MSLRLLMQDTDGDSLEFRLTPQGKLQELQDGCMEMAELRALEYVAAEGLVRDAGGDFNFRPEERGDKAMVLRALAACAGVTWHGDEPEAPERVQVMDTDGDMLDFRINADGRLQEYMNGKLEIADVRRIIFSRHDGRVDDGEGSFRIRSQECLEKSVLLRVLAALAGAEWSGDEPVPLRKAAVTSWLRRFAAKARVRAAPQAHAGTAAAPEAMPPAAEAEPGRPGDAAGPPDADAEGWTSDDESWELLSSHSSRSHRSWGWELLEVEASGARPAACR